MDNSVSIRTPWSQRWGKLRARLVPVALFVFAMSVVSLLWRANVLAPERPGEFAIRSNIISPRSGKLSELNVTRMQRVRAGEVIGKVIATDPQIVESSLRIIQAQINLLRIQLASASGQQHLAESSSQRRLAVMDHRVQLVMARVRLEAAESALARGTHVVTGTLTCESTSREADTSGGTALQVEVEERRRLVAELDDKLKRLLASGSTQRVPDDVTPESLLVAIASQEERLRQAEIELIPIELAVETEGTITSIHRRCGERIVAGETIATVTVTGTAASGVTNSNGIAGHLPTTSTFRSKDHLLIQPGALQPTERRSERARAHPLVQASL